jgi:hypothetical protein
LTYTNLKGRSRIRWSRDLVSSGGGDFSISPGPSAFAFSIKVASVFCLA